jgi:hypothetical protein
MGAFDDLIPASGKTSGTFDDLIPSSAKQSPISVINERIGRELIRFPKYATETGAGVVSGMAGWLGGSATELASLPFTSKERAKELGEKVSRAISYTPEDVYARGAVETAGKIFEPVVGMAREAIDLPMESWGVPKDSKLRRAGNISAELATLPITKRAGRSIKGELIRQGDIVTDFSSLKDIVKEVKGDRSITKGGVFDDLIPKKRSGS